MSKILQLRITIIDSKPEIYRVILLEDSLTFYQFHLVIQMAMGWKNAHLYEFYFKNQRIAEYYDFEPNNSIDPEDIIISDIFTELGEKILYCYDFGDNWQHEIKIERNSFGIVNHQLPICIDGEGSCPPEDCGGIYSYYQMLDVLKDPTDSEYQDTLDWVGEDFDPNYFNKDRINQIIKGNSDVFKIQKRVSAPEDLLNLDYREGYSMDEIYDIVSSTFVEEFPIVIKKLDESYLQQIPILKQIQYLMEIIQKNEEIKLTVKGNLPRKLIKELLKQKLFIETHYQTSRMAVINENDSMIIHLNHILLKLAKLAKKRNNKLSLTKLGQKTLKDENLLLKQILLTFCLELNWGYFDGFDDDQIGRFGFGFSLILIDKYGDQKKLESFYADKYFKLFQHLRMKHESPHLQNLYDSNKRCFNIRTFERFLHLFGLINYDVDNDSNYKEKFVTKTDLFDKLFAVIPPAGLSDIIMGES